jgi:acetoin utilization deacetylase AcuC-like enzyme
VIAGTLPRAELRKIGFPWSPALIERSRRSTGATLAGALDALNDGRAANLAGGTHHAGRARGGGYCVFNDSAVTLKTLESRGLIKRGLVIDLDVHQGDGTADILGGDPNHFCFSMHGARNYPFHKERSDLDVALEDGAGDEVYLEELSAHLPRVFEQSRPDLVVFLAGADPYALDQLGRLNLSKAGLAARDALVFESCDRYGLPVVISMGGGYAPNVHDIVEIHLNTLRLARGYPPVIHDDAS